MDENIIARITVGPDEYGDGRGGPAWCGSITDPDGNADCIDGARGHGPRTTPGRYPTPDQWLRLLRRHVKLPRDVKRAGLKWADADVRPYGWSPGPGCAPHGVRVTWWRS